MSFNKRKLSPIKPGELIDYTSVKFLKSYLTKQGKIRPRRSTKLTLKQQRQLAKAVKQARILGLLAFVFKSDKSQKNKNFSKNEKTQKKENFSKSQTFQKNENFPKTDKSQKARLLPKV